MKERAHGTRAKYVHERCRCFQCRCANTDYQTAREAALHRREPYRTVYVRMLGEWIVRHRETLEIIMRTSDKEEAHTIARQRNRDAARVNKTDRLWASERQLAAARKHLVLMQQQRAVGYKTIARQAGISSNRLLSIICGESKRRDRPTALRVRLTTLAKIMSVDADAAPGARIPAGECNRMIDEMLASGMTKMELAARLGQRGNPPSLQINRRFVLASTLAKVRKVHDDYWRENFRFRDICRCSWWAR